MVKQYKYYSFDLWLTLIKSNKEFKLKRAELFFSRYNPRDFPISLVTNIIKRVDSYTNRYCEMTGQHVLSERMIFDILYILGVEDATLADILNIDMRIQELFLEYPPTLYDENTKDVLKGLVNNGYSLNIASNTGFIHGKTLRVALGKLDIQHLFDFFVFSDEIGISKPNPKFFKAISIYNYGRPFFSEKDILHIGDNPIADGGCKNGGIDYFQINSNDKTIKDLL